MSNIVERHFCKLKRKPSIHDNKTYDLEIDTSNFSPEECAFIIEEKLKSFSFDYANFGRHLENSYWEENISTEYNFSVFGN